MKIAICDDDKVYRDYLHPLVETIFDGFEIMEYSSGKELLNDTHNFHECIILDVHLKDSNGIDVAAEIRKVNRDVVLIFCSGISWPSVESTRLSAYRYLMKSMDENEIVQDLNAAFQEVQRIHLCKTVCCETDKGEILAQVKDIVQISKMKNGSQLKILGQSDETILAYSTQRLKKFSDDLIPFGFAFASSSYIINLRHVRRMNKNEIFLSGDIIETASRQYLQSFKREWLSFNNRKY